MNRCSFGCILTAALAVGLMLPSLHAAEPARPRPDDLASWFVSLKRPYVPQPKLLLSVQPVDRLRSLIRGGTIYLTLQDMIALALESNLDIESARLLPRLADTDTLRASAGQLLRNIPTSIIQAPPSVSGPLAGAAAIGYQNSGAGQPSNSLGGSSVQLAGSQIPNLDPVLYSAGQFSHQTEPQANSIVSGANFLFSATRRWQFGLQKSFLSGTTADLSWMNINLRQNAPNNGVNPATRANFAFTVQQRLLQGFGFAANTRAIRIAKNNRKISDLILRQQIIATVSQSVNLYHDLNAFRDQLKVKQAALAAVQQLVEDNKKRVDIGWMAPLEAVHTEAELAAHERDVADAETQILGQELTLKNVLCRNGLDDADVINARLVPLDHFHSPEQEEFEAPAALGERALRQRLEIEQSRLNLDSKAISLKGVESALKPKLDTFVRLQNNALAGQLNPASPIPAAAYFAGDYGTVLRQLLSRSFPDYAVGFELSVPLRNRAAQADMARDNLDLRLQEIANRKLRNEIRLEALRAGLGLRQARTAYQASVKSRKLMDQSYEAEQKMYALGITNIMRLIGVQRDLETRQLEEITALNTYARAKNNFFAVMGDTLEEHHIAIDESNLHTPISLPEPGGTGKAAPQ